MALSKLHWFRLPRQYSAVKYSGAIPASFPSSLDAIWNAINSPVYYNGVVRIPGVTPTAVKNFAREVVLGSTVAVYGEFGTTTAIGAKWIIGGTGAAPAPLPPLMNSGYNTSGYLYGMITKGGGAYTTWNNAVAPFTGATCFGYNELGNTSMSSGAQFIWFDVYECEEGLWIDFGTMNGVSPVAFTNASMFMGGLIEPGTPSMFGESDGRIYCQGTSGGQVSTSFLTGTVGGGPLGSTAGFITAGLPAVNSGGHYTFSSLNATMPSRNSVGRMTGASAAGTTVRTMTDGTRLGIPFPICTGNQSVGGVLATTVPVTTWMGPEGACLGRFREVYMVRDFAHGVTLQDDATLSDLAYVSASASWNVQNQAIALGHT